MVLQQDTYLGLLSAVTEGLPNLSALEFEYEEEMSMAEPSNQFKDAIAKRELPIKVSIHAPSSMSVAAMKAGSDPPELFLSYGK